MFVFSVKTSYKQLLSALGCVSVVTVAVVLSVLLPHDAVAVSMQVSDSTERVALLQAWGYDVATESEQVREVRIPDETDAALEEYNALQESSGRSLVPYRGKRVRLYTYNVTKPSGETVTANLYVYRDRLIAGDVAGEALPAA